MSKRKLPGGLAVADAAKMTCTDSDVDECTLMPAQIVPNCVVACEGITITFAGRHRRE
jgi:hypothetical protein